jgi:hypothetical protein
MFDDKKKALQLPWKISIFIKIYQQEMGLFRKMIQMDKYRYGKPKDQKGVREGKIRFEAIKVCTNDRSER